MPDPNAPWHQRQATSCGAYALAHALRLASGTLDTNRDGTIQQQEWERVHREAEQMWGGIQFQQGPLAEHKYSSPAAMATHNSGRVEGLYMAGGPDGLRRWAEGKRVMNNRLAMTDLLEMVLQEARSKGSSVRSGDGLQIIQSAPRKMAAVPADAGSYLHYVLFRSDGRQLFVYDSQSSRYEWKQVPKPSLGGSFSTPGSAGSLKYLGLSLVIA